VSLPDSFWDEDFDPADLLAVARRAYWLYGVTLDGARKRSSSLNTIKHWDDCKCPLKVYFRHAEGSSELKIVESPKLVWDANPGPPTLIGMTKGDQRWVFI